MARVPVVALIGRPNVGKSTLFNRLTRSRAALVADLPGLTRDRHYGHGRLDDLRFLVVDTGGFEPVVKTGIVAAMAHQTRQAVVEADVVLFVVDGRDGLTPQDQAIAVELRRARSPVLVVVNKTEGMPGEQAVAEFHALGLGEPVPISAAHGDYVRQMIELALQAAAGAASEGIGPVALDPSGAAGGDEADVERAGPRVRIAVVGRPNVGKSTLINTLIGEQRLIAFDVPGTTRDAIAVDFERGARAYTLIDTAGIRRRGKVTETVEKFSVIKTLQAIEDAQVVVLMLDARDGVAEQDAHIASFILEAGRAVVVAVNKWDGLQAAERERVRFELARKLAFLGFARTHFVSALKATGISALMNSVDEAFRAATAKLPTPRLTRALHAAVERQPPPRRGPIRPKLRYAHQGGRNPPVIVVHGTALDAVPQSYRRYLENCFREQFELVGTPLRVELRTGTNPYAAR